LNALVFHSVGARMSQLADAIPEINRRVLYRVLNRLMNERLGYVSQNSRGEPYKITEEGVKALNVTSGSGDGRREGEAAG
jgi:DNA-binding HxlR family transcriptional regulator